MVLPVMTGTVVCPGHFPAGVRGHPRALGCGNARALLGASPGSGHGQAARLGWPGVGTGASHRLGLVGSGCSLSGPLTAGNFRKRLCYVLSRAGGRVLQLAL